MWWGMGNTRVVGSTEADWAWGSSRYFIYFYSCLKFLIIESFYIIGKKSLVLLKTKTNKQKTGGKEKVRFYGKIFHPVTIARITCLENHFATANVMFGWGSSKESHITGWEAGNRTIRWSFPHKGNKVHWVPWGETWWRPTDQVITPRSTDNGTNHIVSCQNCLAWM